MDDGDFLIMCGYGTKIDNVSKQQHFAFSCQNENTNESNNSSIIIIKNNNQYPSITMHSYKIPKDQNQRELAKQIK